MLIISKNLFAISVAHNHSDNLECYSPIGVYE